MTDEPDKKALAAAQKKMVQRAHSAKLMIALGLFHLVLALALGIPMLFLGGCAFLAGGYFSLKRIS